MLSLFSKNKYKKEPCLFYHTDIHSHLCPGIDDGAKDLSTAIELISGLNKLGITRMIITPHVTDEVFPNNATTINNAFNQLLNAPIIKQLNIQLSCSAEYRIDNLLSDQLRSKSVIPLPNDYILVENSWIQEPFNLEGFLYSLQSDYGYRPILAHPERYEYYLDDKDRLLKLHNNGVLFQTNLLSLSGRYGKKIKRFAESLLNDNLVDFIGSDMHHHIHLEEITKYILSKDYAKLLKNRHTIKNDIAFV